MRRAGDRVDSVATWLQPGAAHGYSYEPHTPPPGEQGGAASASASATRRERRERRERCVASLPTETSCQPARRRFDVPDDVDGECGDSSDTFDFVPMDDEETRESPWGVPEEILVCEPPSMPGMCASQTIRVSSELGYAQPRSAANSSAGSGSSSLRVSTSSFCSSFCSSHDTIVDADSDYRAPSRADRKKNFAEEIGAAVAAAAAAAAAAESSDDAVVVSRPTAPRAARAARPPSRPSGPAPDAHQPAAQPTRDDPDRARRAERPSEPADWPEDSSGAERPPHAHAPEGRPCTKNFYPDALCGHVSPAQTAAAAARWKDRVIAQSPLLPTDRYDYTMKQALSKIQQYR